MELLKYMNSIWRKKKQQTNRQTNTSKQTDHDYGKYTRHLAQKNYADKQRNKIRYVENMGKEVGGRERSWSQSSY